MRPLVIPAVIGVMLAAAIGPGTLRAHDVAEYWEWCDQGGFFPVDFTNDACKLGVNYIVYGMTH